MDEELRDSLMEWWLTHGERIVRVDDSYLSGGENKGMQKAFNSKFVHITGNSAMYMGFRLTPEGIEALKNGI